MFDPLEPKPTGRGYGRNEPFSGVRATTPEQVSGAARVGDGPVADEMKLASESTLIGMGSGASKVTGRMASSRDTCPSGDIDHCDAISGDIQASEQSWVVDSVFDLRSGLPGSPGRQVRRAPGSPVVGLRSVKQDWIGGRSSSEPCSDPSSGALAGAESGDAYGGDDMDPVTSLAEDILVAELHRLWLAQRPAWVDPSWYDAHIRPQVRGLLLLAPGPELLAAVSVVGSGPCPASHAEEGFPCFPTLGSEPGFACDCQLAVAAAWQACESWVQSQATRHLVDIMGEDPVVVPSDGVAPGTVDPGREEAALMLRYNVRSFANRVDTARGIDAHPDLVDLAESGACSFWTVRFLASDLANLTDEQARKVTGELIGKVTERIQAGARPWTGSQIRAAAKRLIARLCPKDQAGARARAWQGRRVQVWPRDHGMSVLAATISDTDAHRILRRLTNQAAELSDPERTRDQKRADVLADTLLTSPILQPPDAEVESLSPSPSPFPPSSRSCSVRVDVDVDVDVGAGESVSATKPTDGSGGGSGDGESITPAVATGQDSGGVAGAESRSASTASSVSSTASSTSASVGPESGSGAAAEVCVVVKLETLLGLVDDSPKSWGWVRSQPVLLANLPLMGGGEPGLPKVPERSRPPVLERIDQVQLSPV